MERLIKSRRDGHHQEIVRPGVMRFLDFARLQLPNGEKYSTSTGGRESVLDFFSGKASITLENKFSVTSASEPMSSRLRP
jgi:5-deoxy-D-glucuronate isomerase